VIYNISGGVSIDERMERLSDCKKCNIDVFVRRKNQWNVLRGNLRRDGKD
jgi:hypothetical protein